MRSTLATRRGWTALQGELGRILGEELVFPVFQPIVELEDGRVIGYEALARGPRDSLLETPRALFAVAREAGKLPRLDRLCRARALELAEEAGLPAGTGLFVNVEGDALPESWTADYEPPDGLRSFVEVTERALTARPAELVAAVERLRERGWGVALDDVGADMRSLALMPLLQPDVIKLELRLVEDRPTTEVAAIVDAVLAEHERTGAAILAEGVETHEHLETARSLGATLAQGWLLGRPGPLDG